VRLGGPGAEPLARAVIDPGDNDREQQKHQKYGGHEQKRIRGHFAFLPKLDESASDKSLDRVLTWIKFANL
jgi:hypothetical protein